MKSVQRAKALNMLLNECNFPAVCIHRGMDQKERINVYSQFKENKARGRAGTCFRVGAAVRLRICLGRGPPAQCWLARLRLLCTP